MKILQANLAAAVKATLLNLQLGLYNANVGGSLSIDPEATVTFQMEVVTATGFNSIVRTQTTTPAAAEVTTDVTNSYSETTTQSPATTQSDNMTTSGSSSDTQTTTYSEFST